MKCSYRCFTVGGYGHVKYTKVRLSRRRATDRAAASRVLAAAEVIVGRSRFDILSDNYRHSRLLKTLNEMKFQKCDRLRKNCKGNRMIRGGCSIMFPCISRSLLSRGSSAVTFISCECCPLYFYIYYLFDTYVSSISLLLQHQPAWSKDPADYPSLNPSSLHSYHQHHRSKLCRGKLRIHQNSSKHAPTG